MKEVQCPIPGNKAFVMDGGCTVFVGREPLGPMGTMRWHLSISHPKRYPTWNEIHEARYKLIPDSVTVALILPPKAEYVNIHENCFHLNEIRE